MAKYVKKIIISGEQQATIDAAAMARLLLRHARQRQQAQATSNDVKPSNTGQEREQAS